MADNVILAGDFNVHHCTWLGSTKTTLAGEALEDIKFCALLCLEQPVRSPTRGDNLFDLVISNIPGKSTISVAPPVGRLDHAVVITDFHALNLQSENTSRTVWRYNLASWPLLRAYIRPH